MSLASSQDELSHLLELLKTEREEDKIQYEQNILSRSIHQRRDLGVTWYPLVIKENYYGAGERLILELERPSHTDISHQFQFGCVASLFSNAENRDDEYHSISGIVTAVRRNNLRLTLFADELPEWANKGKLGIDLLFDESSYKEMEFAVKQVMKSKNNRIAELREVLLGHTPASFLSLKERTVLPSLNESQNKALNNVLAAQDIAIIHGPPGTGKTTTLVHTIKEVLKEEDRILVCAPSNAAVDLLTERLADEGVKVLRIGHPARISDTLLKHSLDQKITDHSEYKMIKEFKKRAIEYKNMASKYKRNFGREERQQRKLILDEARRMQTEAEDIEKFIVNDLFEKAEVILSTLVGSANYLLKGKEFHTVMIDEAAQALEPACWIPIMKAQRIVLAGDHCQLPPTIKSNKAAKDGLAVTLFEKSIQRQEADVMLDVQYRMHKDIMGFSAQQFYKGALHAHSSVAERALPDLLPIEFIDTAGCGYEEELNKENASTYNPGEADLLLKIVENTITHLNENNLVQSIGIVTPYKAQRNLIEEKREQHESLKNYAGNISVNTVDAFQGQERDIMIISLVRSNDKGEIGFLSDIRRMNVAMTRARKRLVVIGDSATLANHEFYRSFIEYTEKLGAYKSAWEFIS